MPAEEQNAKELFVRIRQVPLAERLERCRKMVAAMRSEGRPPKMSISRAWDDEDFFIDTTLGDAMIELRLLTEMLEMYAPESLQRFGEMHNRRMSV